MKSQCDFTKPRCGLLKYRRYFNFTQAFTTFFSTKRKFFTNDAKVNYVQLRKICKQFAASS